MQSTSVDVVSVNPAAGVEAEAGHAESAVTSVADTAVSAVVGAAEATDTESAGTSADITAIAVNTPRRFLKLENIVSSILVNRILLSVSPPLHVGAAHSTGKDYGPGPHQVSTFRKAGVNQP